ncbi:MAG: DMT family transporter [Fidelibacterota bacterium]
MKPKVAISYSILCVIWGTTWVILKKSIIDGTPPIYGVGLRFVLAGLILLAVTAVKGKSIPRSRKAINTYILFTLMNFVFAYGLSYYAAQFIYSNLSSILWAGFPFVIVIISHFYLKNERLTPNKIITILIGTVGVILILSQGKTMGGNQVFLGMGLTLLAVIGAAWPNVYLKKNIESIDPLSMNGICQTSAGIILLSISYFVEAQQTMVWSPFNIFAIVYLTLFGTVAAWMVYIWLFKHISMTQIAYIAFPPPVIAFMIGWYFLDETLTLLSILGAVIVIIGAVIVNLKR